MIRGTAAAGGRNVDTRDQTVERAETIRGRWADARYNRELQYATPANLDARIALHRQFSTNPLHWMRWLFDQIEAAPDARVLDVGCGPALLWVENRDRTPTGWAVTLLDLSPGMLDAARERIGPDDRFDFVVGDAQELPFPTGTFDVTAANHMLYHVPDRARAIRELRRVTCGTAYVSTIGADHLQELHELVIGRGDAPLGFLLENGEQELREAFEHVELRVFEDSLAVTEVEPLMAVVQSGVAADLIDDDELDAIRSRVADTIARAGVFRITKSTGVFVCR